MTALFTPLRLGGVTLRNRVALSPMCQYSASDGTPTDWHFVHLGRYAAAGLGLINLEATHVSAVGRITPGCLGLWTDAHEAAHARIITFLRGVDPDVKVGLQVAHAGRKASADVPWRGGKPLAQGAWPTVAPSPIPHDDGWHVPHELSAAELPAIAREFADSAARAARAGYDVVELHAAHGYLLHEFTSPISNRRTDAYGGTLEKRLRFPLEAAEAVRAVWPRDKALGARITGTDYMGSEGTTVEDAIVFARELKGLGYDFVDVSGGGISMRQKFELKPGYQVDLAARIRQEAKIPVFAVGLITEPAHAEQIIARGEADALMIGRALLRDPLWTWAAADALGATTFCPPQYLRGRVLGPAAPKRETVVAAAVR
jgi:2,4-dienoyl-CoA reductase-like NADH-dependent reductase (Old Yellow Enzyme family)